MLIILVKSFLIRNHSHHQVVAFLPFDGYNFAHKTTDNGKGKVPELLHNTDIETCPYLTGSMFQL